MSPEERKSTSESLLRDRGVRINAHLPLVESDEAVCLRSAQEVLQRLVALWAVVGSAFLPNNLHFREYIAERKYESWLSEQELAFLLDDTKSERDYVQYSWKLECLYFIAWCAGLIESIEIPSSESSVESIMNLFPQKMEEPTELRRSISVRGKDEIMAWADLLYRLHWAVRDARLTGQPIPPGISGDVVQEWHLAVNWMTRYCDEDNWDHVGTDT